MGTSLKKQALALTAANAYTRALGLGLRLVIARLMGAEALGVMELSGSAAMLAITPVTAGVPTAMSRMAARPDADAAMVLRAGVRLALRLSLVLLPVLLVLSPLLAWLLGDMRTLMPILTSLPQVVLLGQCAAHSGWFFGRGDALTPSICECAEQTVRCLLVCVLLMLLGGHNAGLTASLPGLAESAAGVVVLLLFRRRAPLRHSAVDPSLTREIIHLAAPITLSRLCQTALRSLNAVVLPACLRRSGLGASAAVSQYGLLTGMVGPLLMLPGIVTGALGTVAIPAIARQERQPRQLVHTARRLMLCAAGVGAAASSLCFLGAGFIGHRLYQEPAMIPLLRLMSPAALLSSMSQIQYAFISGLGLQRRALTASVASTAATLVITALLSPHPQIRIFGAAIANLISAGLRLVWQQIILHRAIR